MFDNLLASRLVAAVLSVTISAAFFAYAIIPASPNATLSLGIMA